MGLKWRVVNESPVTLVAGSFGITPNMTARLTVQAGQTEDFTDQFGNFLTLDEGKRVFVIWDKFTGEVKGHKVLTVDDNFGQSLILAVFNNFNMDAAFN